MRFCGIDLAWSTGKTGVCLIEKEVSFFLLSPEELFEFPFKRGLYFIDAPLGIPEAGIREVDRKLSKVTSITVLPANKRLFPNYLPEKFIKYLKNRGFREWKGERRGGGFYAESFVPYLRKKSFGRAKFAGVEIYRTSFYKKFGFLPEPPSPHLLDAYLLAVVAKESFAGKPNFIEASDGRIYL